jgi:hypothetical protein
VGLNTPILGPAGGPTQPTAGCDHGWVGEDAATPLLLDDAVCGVCGGSLLPLTYPQGLPDHEPRGTETRAAMECAGCGQRYRWQDSAGWVPLGTL